MKLKYIKDIDKFFETINKCEGDVELISKEGDRLNLKSTLTQFVSKAIFNNDEIELELIAHNPSDGVKLMEYMMGQ